MAQPLYFLPDLRHAAADSIPLRKQILQERGLADVFADVPFAEQPLAELTGRGPGEKPGCILGYQTASGGIPRRLGYYPKEQAWTPVGNGSLVWIGVDTAEPPKPEEMARKKQHNGYWIDFGDAGRWLIPIIRRPDDSTELPSDLVWDATGRFTQPIKAAYQSFWDDTAEVAAHFFEDKKLPLERATELAIKALSLNYRYGRNEQNVLRVIDRDNYQLVLGCTVDLPGAEDSQKKVPNAAPGLPESSPDTALVDGICT